MKPILASLAALAAFATAQPRYTITDLGNVGATPGQPFTIVNTGLIAGAAGAANGATQAVLWYQGLKGDIALPGLGGPQQRRLRRQRTRPGRRPGRNHNSRPQRRRLLRVQTARSSNQGHHMPAVSLAAFGKG